MKKAFIIKFLVLASAITMIGACGGGGGQGGEIRSNQNQNQNPDALSISSVQGDGSGADRVASALIINGANFSEGMDVELKTVSTTNTFKLSYTLNSQTQVKATLPQDVAEGDYELVVAKGSEKATASVTILKGEKGETGAQGPAGANGISMATQFSCGGSNDIDNTNDTRSACS